MRKVKEYCSKSDVKFLLQAIDEDLLIYWNYRTFQLQTKEGTKVRAHNFNAAVNLIGFTQSVGHSSEHLFTVRPEFIDEIRACAVLYGIITKEEVTR